MPTLIVLVLVGISYFHTLTYPWHLDDLPNILENSAVQINDFAPDSLFRAIFAAEPFTGRLSRPLSYFTFALNWYWGESNPIGYHVINILIHIVTSVLLFISIELLFNCSVKLNERYSKKSSRFIALFASLLWALHPIQIQGVTYIVQRMTSLAGLFSILSIYWFIRQYAAEQTPKRTKLLILSSLSFFCAISAKENPALLPISFLLIHFAFFGSDQRSYSRRLFQGLTGVSILIVVGSVYYLYKHNLFHNLFTFAPFGGRPYSLYERLLTEPRIVLFYVSLLFYPLPERFSVDHSIELSTGLLTPWSTLPVIFLWVVVVIVAIKYLRKYPLFSFPVLFFILHHIIESSIIPLELVFEHRNYLPSFFIFIPVAVLLHKAFIAYRNDSKLIKYCVCFFAAVIVAMLCWSTFMRNRLWSSPEVLWTDAARKAPHNARPFSYLGQIYGWERPKSKENLDKAVQYYKAAIGKMGPLTSFNEPIVGNIAGIYFNYGLYEQAEAYYRQSIKEGSRFTSLPFGLAKVLVMREKFEAALAQLNGLLENPDVKNLSRVYNLRGLIYLWQGKYQKATDDFHNAIINTNDKKRYFYNMGVALSLSGYPKQAEWFLKSALRHDPSEIIIVLSIIENELRWQHEDKAIKYARNLIRIFPEESIRKTLVDPGTERFRSVPLDYQLVTPVIEKAFAENSDI